MDGVKVSTSSRRYDGRGCATMSKRYDGVENPGEYADD